jgi:mannose-6-phosphate isomerase-like protein (cupin superfamily)
VPILIPSPTRVRAAGTKPKRIDEYVGRANSGTDAVSIAHMRSPAGWVEPGQRPEFDEYTLVLRGKLRIEHGGGRIDVRAGQAVLVRAGEWIRYSTPAAGGAEYVAVCIPAFSSETVHRDADGGSTEAPPPKRAKPRARVSRARARR